MKKKIGYIFNAFDMFNIHHLNTLKRAKELCDRLIVGVSFNQTNKNIESIIPFNERVAIVESIKYVDEVVPHDCEKHDQLFHIIQSNGVNLVFVSKETEKIEVLNILKNYFVNVECVVIQITNDEVDASLSSTNLQTVSVDKKIGYTTGVFDMFHIGHLNILKRAKELCDYLIVGVSTDELVANYKSKTPIVPFVERKAIIEAVKYVDLVVPQINMNKFEAWKKIHFNVLFHGDDWKGSSMYRDVEEKLSSVGCKVVFLPHTDGISSTMLRQKTKVLSDFSDIVLLGGISKNEIEQLLYRTNPRCWTISNVVVSNIIYTDNLGVLSIEFEKSKTKYVIEAKTKCKALGFNPNDRLDNKTHEIEIDLNTNPTISLLFNRCGDISFEVEALCIIKTQSGARMNLSVELEKQGISEMEKIKLIKDENEIYYGTILSLKENHKSFLNLELLEDIKFVIGIGLVAKIK